MLSAADKWRRLAPRWWVLCALAAAFCAAPAAAGVEDLVSYHRAVKDCQGSGGPCCREVRDYRRCLRENSGVVKQREGGAGAPLGGGSGLEAVPACKPVEAVMKSCFDRWTARRRQPEAPEAPAEKPAGRGLLRNPDFSSGLAGWTVAGGGYGGSPRARKVLGPKPGEGEVRLGACGGTRTIYQKVPVDGLDLAFSGAVRVERWSTYGGGRPGGWVSVGFSFLDAQGQVLQSVHNYLNPKAPHQDKPRVHWRRLEGALPAPTKWRGVWADVADSAARLGVDPGRVEGVMVFATVFGTHEDGVPTVADFSSLSLAQNRPTAAPEPRPVAAEEPPAPWVEELAQALPGLVGTERFLVLEFGPRLLQFAGDPRLPEVVMDVPAGPMTPGERARFEREFPGFHRVDYAGGYSYQLNYSNPREAARAARRVAGQVWRLAPGSAPRVEEGIF